MKKKLLSKKRLDELKSHLKYRGWFELTVEEKLVEVSRLYRLVDYYDDQINELYREINYMIDKHGI